MGDSTGLGELLSESDHAYSVELAPWKGFEALMDLEESTSIVNKVLGGNVWIPFPENDEGGDEDRKPRDSA